MAKSLKRVLIVEDDPGFAFCLYRALRRRGIQDVDWARDGREGAKYVVKSAEVNLIFAGSRTTPGDDVDFLSWLQRNPQFQIPVVAFSSGHDPSRGPQPVKLSFMECFEKPGSAEELQRFVDDLADNWTRREPTAQGKSEAP